MKKPKMILCDVDGTLTDGMRVIDDDGRETKSFYVPDGSGLIAIQKLGILTGIVTADSRPLLQFRAKQLKLDILETGVHDKLNKIREICVQREVSIEEIGFIGDDINDYLILKAVGFAACPADAQLSVKKIPGIYQTNAPGGRGAVREWLESLYGEEVLLKAFLGPQG